MPRGDRTGPTGAGPGTGRMRGFCMGFGTPGTSNSSQNFASPGEAAAVKAGATGFSIPD